MDEFARSELLLGKDNMNRLADAKVCVFGVGGVGGYVVEALARAGIGSFLLVDNDTICLTNINRQIIATHQTIDQYKVDVMKNRILDINPNAQIEIRKCFYLPENAHEFDFSEYSYVVDAVDTVTAKLEIIQKAKEAGTPVISSMGTGNKMDPTKFEVADIYKTSMCPLAKVMRHECKKRGIKQLKVVYSTEAPMKPLAENKESFQQEKLANPEKDHIMKGRRDTPGSLSFVPSVAGLIIASEVVKDLIK